MEKSTIKVRKEGAKYILAVLVYSGATLGHAQSYEPRPKPQNKAAIANYIPSVEWKSYKYSPQISKRDWRISEQRRADLMANIAHARKEIRNHAIKMRIDANTTIQSASKQVLERHQVAMLADGLMTRIANRWEKTHQKYAVNS